MRSPNRWVLAGLAVLWAASGCSRSPSEQAPQSLAEATLRAAQADQLVLVDFYTQW
jgi:hypothetical protein